MHRKIWNTSIMLCLLVLGVTACAATHNPQLAAKCTTGLDQVTAKYDAADAKGFSGATRMMKAAALIAAAKIQQQFDKYPNCINKVQRAQVYIRQAVAQK